jgi:hypothetical protein
VERVVQQFCGWLHWHRRQQLTGLDPQTSKAAHSSSPRLVIGPQPLHDLPSSGTRAAVKDTDRASATDRLGPHDARYARAKCFIARHELPLQFATKRFGDPFNRAHVRTYAPRFEARDRQLLAAEPIG